MKWLLSLIAAFSFVSSIQAADAPRPNILFIIFDDWGWQHAGAYGCDWVKTPNFDRVAKEGVLFKNAFTSNPKCSPCRATILTGRNSWQLEEAVCHGGIFPPKFAVYPDLLETSGYTVGLTGKGWGPGEFKLEGRTRNPAGPAFDEFKQKTPTKGITTTDYSSNFDGFLAQRDKAKPFCFWMGFKEPHRTYELDSGVRMGKKLSDVKVPGYLPDNDWGYPVRAIRTPEFFYSHNYHPERWPACNPETGFGNCDDGPTKSWIVDHQGPFFDLAFAYRAEEELFDIAKDPECLKNLAGDPKFAAKKQELRSQMEVILKDEKDPRVLGNAAIFDTYKYLGNRSKKGYAEWEAAQKGQPLPEEPKKKGKKSADE